jgi:hypothetical protein
MNFRRGKDPKKSLNIGRAFTIREKIKQKYLNDHKSFPGSSDDPYMQFLYTLYYGTLSEFKFIVEEDNIDKNELLDAIVKILQLWPKGKMQDYNVRYAERKLRYLLDRGLPIEELKNNKLLMYRLPRKAALKVLEEYGIIFPYKIPSSAKEK